MGDQLRAQNCTADEAIGLSGIVLYGRWVNPSQRPGVNYGDSLCALKTFRDLDKAPSAKTFFTLSKAKDRDALTQFWAHGHQLLVDGGRNQCASTTQSAYGERGASSCQRRISDGTAARADASVWPAARRQVCCEMPATRPPHTIRRHSLCALMPCSQPLRR
jgi:hypothetical protein